MNLLIKDVKILDIDRADIRVGCIAIRNGVFDSVVYNDTDDAASDGADKNELEKMDYDRVIDGKGKLAMPGFCNSHTHIPMTILRNYADDQSLWKWLNNHIWPAESKLTAEDVYWGSMLGVAELLKFGNTCFIDMYFFIDEIGKVLAETKMRGFVSRGLIGNDDRDYKQLDETEHFIKKWHNQENGRIKGMVGPHAPYTCSPSYLKKAIELSEKYDTSIHIHLSESDDEVQESLKNFGMTPTEHMESIGIFKRNTVAAHCVKLTDKDIDILAENRVNVLYNPTSNMKLGNGFARINDMISKGINIALGTDGCASNNNLNLIEEIKIASLVNKGVSGDPKSVPAIESVRMATVNGIKAGCLENELGAIEKGKKADIILLDLDKIQTTPENNIISSLAYSIQSDNVCCTIVDGNILMENGEFTTIDIEKTKYNVRKIAERIAD